MKFITKFKSPNFNDRKNNKILFIIIHYTAIKNNNDAISHLCNPKNKVSSHFLISQNGNIFKLVNEKKRAWHAGKAYWNGIRDINSCSLGIELDFSNNKINNKYSNQMIKALIFLLKKFKKKYKIKSCNILGHSDISPYRKKDPGKKFPWHKLSKYDLAYKISVKDEIKINIIKDWFIKYRINTSKKIALFILGFIGYDTTYIRENKNLFKNLIFAYQLHYVQKNITGKVDKLTLKFLINHLLNKLLTKK